MASKRLTVVNEQTGEIEEDLRFSGGYNILYSNHEDDGNIKKILKLNNAKFGDKCWIMNEWYGPIARGLIDKFEEIEHVRYYRIIFIEDRQWEPGNAVWNWKARIKKAGTQFREATGYDYILETRKYYTERMSKEQLILLIYHELKHIGQDGSILHHNIEDWDNIVATFGKDWHQRGQELINILDAQFGSENWRLVLPTVGQLNLFDTQKKE